MAKAELMFGDGMVLRCYANFDLSKVLDVQPARLQGEDVTCTLHWGPGDVVITPFMQKLLDLLESAEAANSGPQVSDVEGE